MHISVISTSHRKKSQSERISQIISSKLLIINSLLRIYNLDTGALDVPFWSPQIKEENSLWGKKWKNISESSEENKIEGADGVIAVHKNNLI